MDVNREVPESKDDILVPGGLERVKNTNKKRIDELYAKGYEPEKIYETYTMFTKKAVTVGSVGSFSDGEEESQAERLIRYTLENSKELFYDQHDTPYIRVSEPCTTCGTCGRILSLQPCSQDVKLSGESVEVPNKNREQLQLPQVPQSQEATKTRCVNMPLRSKKFKTWLSYLMYQKEGKAPGSETVNSALGVLTGKALKEGKKYQLYNRVAPIEDGSGIWLDMADENWRAIKINLEGWEIVDNPPILFKRYKQQQPICEPIRPANIEAAREFAYRILNHVNIKSAKKANDAEQQIEDALIESTKLAVICSCISYLIPLISHPILIVSGPQGSAKSYLHKIVKRTIDPSIPELLDLPHDKNELLQQLDHNWLAFYDNLTSLSNEVSDCLCRAVTGGGFSKRELYSDDDDTVYDFKRCVGLNGINPAASRPDLLDRSVLTSVTKIDDKDRKTEKVVDAAFEADKTSILGGFLTILSEALKKYKVVNLDSYQRLADFHVYGCAISLALGKTAEEFTKAYENKVEGQTEEALNASLVALSLIDFCDKHFKRDVSGSRIIQGNWEGTPSELLDVLTDNCIHLGIKTDFRSKWPKSPSTFGKRINELIPSMYRKGYDIIVKAGTPRQIIIAETPEQIEKYNPKTEDTKDLKTRIEETFGQIIIAYQKGGMVKTETIQDKEALTQLLKDDKLLSPQEGFVIPNRSA